MIWRITLSSNKTTTQSITLVKLLPSSVLCGSNCWIDQRNCRIENLNPIENLWSRKDQKVNKGDVTNKIQLFEALEEVKHRPAISKTLSKVCFDICKWSYKVLVINFVLFYYIRTLFCVECDNKWNELDYWRISNIFWNFSSQNLKVD